MLCLFIKAFRAITQLSEAVHLDKASCTTPPQNVEQFTLHTCTPKFNDTIKYTLVNYHKNPKGESLRGRVSALCFALLWAFALWWQ
jgi:hypothetical protein